MTIFLTALGIWTGILALLLIVLPARRMQFAEVFSASVLVLVVCSGFRALSPEQLAPTPDAAPSVIVARVDR